MTRELPCTEYGCLAGRADQLNKRSHPVKTSSFVFALALGLAIPPDASALDVDPRFHPTRQASWAMPRSNRSVPTHSETP